MRWGGFLIAAFTFGILAGASQSGVAPPMRVAEAPPPVHEAISYVYIKVPEVVSEPTAAIAAPTPRPKPDASPEEAERLRRLRLFDIDGNSGSPTKFRAGPRHTISVN